MKKHIRALLLVAGLAGLVSSCSDDETQTGSIEDLSVEAKSFLALRVGSSEAMKEGRNSAINSSFQGFFSEGGRRAGRKAGDSTDVEPDTTIISPGVPDCADVKFSEIPGGYSTSVDYGEGCDLSWGDFIYIVYGKYSQKNVWKLTQNDSEFENEYEFESEYENYGARYESTGLSNSDSLGKHSWSMDGESRYSGVSVYDSINGKFNGSYSNNDDITYTYDDQTYTYFSEGESSYDDKKSTQIKNTYRYTEGTNFYESVVLSPLVYKYTCAAVGGFFENGITASYVSGREKISYKQGDQSGSFIIDYGDGACDNIITIIENGVEIKIDLSKEWEGISVGG